ncbi:MAG TPA: type II toxin-antitoxin system VapC family toxin [Longimicrobiaceae bacterium]
MAGDLLLDTSLVVDVLSQKPAAERIVEDADALFLPVPALGELHLGVQRSLRPDAALARLTSFVALVDVLDCDSETARIYGDVKAVLLAKGRPLPENDIWIASLARQHGLTVATRDAHFSEVAGLSLLSW